MLLIRRAQIGAVAYARMARDGTVTPLLPGVARPLDVPESPGLRAMALSPWVPRHTTVSGLAGLWLQDGLRLYDGRWLRDGLQPHEGAGLLSEIDVVGARGLHRTVNPAPQSAIAVRFHSGNAAREDGSSIDGMAVAERERCVIDALRWSPAEVAVPAAVGTLQSRLVSLSGLQERFACDDPRGAGYRRLATLWGSLVPYLKVIAGGASSQ